MQIFDELTYINNSSLALGYFDGIHSGHRVVLKNAVNFAKKNNSVSTVVTFVEHPLNYITGKKAEQILSVNERLEILKTLGIDNVVMLNFKDFASIKAEDYLQNILVKYFTPVSITTGFNHNFGFNKEGNSEFLRKYQNKYGYRYFEIPPFIIDGNIVSCSTIKNMINTGNFYEANKLLDYNYFIRAKVIKGERIASKLGFASANVIYPDYKVKIPFGVYFVKVDINDKIYNGILNYGCSPTLNKAEIKTEVHIIGFDRNIYDNLIKINFISKIREQIKFENIEKLKAQINRDIAFTEIYSKFIKNTMLY